MLDNAFVFQIPVYNNMDVTIINSANGAVADDSTNESTVAVNTIVTAAGYKISGTNLTGIDPGTSVDDIKNKIAAVGGTVTITPASGNYVGTGSTIVVANKDTSITYKALVKGEVTPTQILSHQIKKTITKKIETYKNYKNAEFDDKLSNMKLNIGKSATNSLSRFNSKIKSNVETKSNNENGFTKFINSIYAKFKGK